MLIPSSKFKLQGFSLIELMVGIAVMAILFGIAMPSFKTMLKNTQIRNAAESVTNGLQMARAEAVARNTKVNFVLGTGTSWTVNVVNSASNIESRASHEGSADVTLTAVNAAATAATTVTFNSFGGVDAANADASAPIAKLDFTANGADKNLRVTIGLGGNARMCDPNISSGTRAC